MMAAVIGVVAMDDEQEADAATTFTVGNLKYRVITDGKVEVSDTTFIFISGSLTIPSSVSDGTKDYNVSRIGEYAFQACSRLTSITIPESVTSIGNYTFSGCSGLTSITIPESVTSIGNRAFQNCSGLTSITIPNSVTSIDDYTFSGCSGLTSITIPESVTSIGYSAFQNCSGLTSITIPESVTSIGMNAFNGCSGLTSVTFTSHDSPNMGNNAFRTGTTIEVTSPWDPVTVMAGAIGTDGKTTIVWANPPPEYPDLTFLSNPVTDGTLAYNPLRTIKTALTA